jgi:hypothetical protein
LALALVSLPALAQAAPPPNDDWQSAIEVAAAPYQLTEDTTEAVRDVAPPTEEACYSKRHSVWFRFTPTETQRLIILTAGSGYKTVLNLYRVVGPDTWEHERCSRTRAGRAAGLDAKLQEGTVYYLMVSSYRGAAGTLQLAVRRPMTTTVTLAGQGRADRVDGTAVVRGTLQCSRPGRTEIYVALRQRVGIHVAKGDRGGWRDCGPEPRTWRLRVIPDGAIAFKLGAARVVTSYYSSCDVDHVQCTSGRAFIRDTVTLN